MAGGVLAALAGAAAYGLNIPAAKIATGYGVDGQALIALRSVASLLVFALAMLAFGWRPRPAPRDLRNILLLGLFSTGTALGYIGAVMRLPVSVAVLVFYMFPLWIILIAVAREGRSALTRMAAFVLAFSGILVVVGGDFGTLDPLGLLLAFGASLSSAAMFLAGSRVRSNRMTALFVVQWPNLFGALGVMLLVTGAPTREALDLATAAIIVSTLGYYVGFTLQIMASQRLAPAAAGLLFLFEPVVSIAAAVLVLGEPMTGMKLGGVALVLSGLVLDVLIEQRRRQRRAPA